MSICNARRWIAAVAVFIGALGLGRAQAIPLQDLTGGDSILVGNILFDDWELQFDNSSGALDLSEIEVTGVGTGLKFTANNGALTVEGGNFIDFGFGFSVTAPAHIKFASLALTGFDFGAGSDGLIIIQDFVFDESFAGLGTMVVEADASFPDFDVLFDSVGFAQQTRFFQEIDIFVDSGFSGSAAGIGTFEVRKVPEPATLAVFGFGLAGLGFLAWRRQLVQVRDGL